MFKTVMASAILMAGAATVATAAIQSERMTTAEYRAHEEENRIIRSPIGGIQNHFWYDYRINNTEAGKELSTDLRHADKTKNEADAWDEYRRELAHNRVHYVKEMAERGYRYGIVTVGDDD